MRTLTLLLLTAIACCAQTLQERRWDAALVPPHKRKAVENVTARLLNNRDRYEAVSVKTGVPWYVIAGLHAMESSGNFGCHLHEGSSLKSRTRWVPKGRPKTGTPPFTWEYSAIDALSYDKMGSKNWASLTATLEACEYYNGSGYARYHPETPTQYLWAFSSIARPGRYVADGKWSSTAVSQQPGIAVLWKTMESRGVLNLKLLKRP